MAELPPSPPLAPVADYVFYSNQNDATGSFNYATDPYTGIPNISNEELKNMIVYTDNGFIPLYNDDKLTELAGLQTYVDNVIRIKLPDESFIGSLNAQYSFSFSNGVINTVFSALGATDDEGYPLVNIPLVCNIIGGAGAFLNAKGIVVLDTIVFRGLSKVSIFLE